MKVSIKNVVLGLAVAFAASTAFGQATLNFTGSGGNNATFSGSGAAVVIAAAVGKDALLAGAATFDLMVTTTSDILLFDAEITDTPGMNVPGGWYNEIGTGSDTNPPNPAFVTVFEQLGFDTWLTTPDAGTAAAGSNTFNGADGQRMVTHSDSVDSGPQTDFNFARVTLIPDAEGNASATFRGTLQTSASPTPVFDDFSYTLTVGAVVPEPASMGLLLTALLGGFSIIRRKRNS